MSFCFACLRGRIRPMVLSNSIKSRNARTQGQTIAKPDDMASNQCTEIVTDPEAAEAGFCTVTVSDPAEATSLAGIATLSCDELMNVVVRGAPFQRATAPGRKPLPDRVNVRFPLPTTIEVWLAPVSVGTGFAFSSEGKTKGPRISRICGLPPPKLP